MDFYETVGTRRTVRDFTGEAIEASIMRKILTAGGNAPSNDHLRDLHFIVLTEKDRIKTVIGKIPKKVSPKRLEFILGSMKLKDPRQRSLYEDAIPKQYQMLSNAGCLVIPLFRQHTNLLKPRALSSLNAFASAWCCIENVLLAAAAEKLGCALRIPSLKEKVHVASVLNIPDDYCMPCYLAIGKPAEDAVYPPQTEWDPDKMLHFNVW